MSGSTPSAPAGLSIPHPLAEVLRFEGVDIPSPGSATGRHPPAQVPLSSDDAATEAGGPDACQASRRTTRWEFFGLPGLGKSTLCRALTSRARERGLPALYLPEAVPYAVRVLGIALADLEPFLDRVNAQADRLAVAFAAAIGPGASPGARPAALILRDPAYVQNESYRHVLHARRDGDAASALLDALAADAARARWRADLATQFGRALVERHAALRAFPKGSWGLGHVILTTTDPIEDLALSRHRQRNPDRDAALVTADPVTLTGYLAAIAGAEVATRRAAGAQVVVLDPRLDADALLDQLDALMQHAPTADRTAAGVRRAETRAPTAVPTVANATARGGDVGGARTLHGHDGGRDPHWRFIGEIGEM